jgi:hypothetical protein
MDLPSIVKGSLSLDTLVFVSAFTIFHIVLVLFLEHLIRLLKCCLLAILITLDRILHCVL